MHNYHVKPNNHVPHLTYFTFALFGLGLAERRCRGCQGYSRCRSSGRSRSRCG